MKAGKWFVTAALFFAGSVFAAGGYLDSLASLDGIKVGVTTGQQVRDLLGPPLNTMRFPARGRGIESLEYEGRGEFGRVLVSISVGNGVVQEVQRRRPPSF